MITVERWYKDDVTLGILSMNGFQCFTLELPWLDNQPNISCIPKGYYDYRRHESPRNGTVLALEGVEDRTHIQMHSGNFTYNIKGCILVGASITFIDNDGIPDLSNSRKTLEKILELSGNYGRIEFK